VFDGLFLAKFGLNRFRSGQTLTRISICFKIWFWRFLLIKGFICFRLVSNQSRLSLLGLRTVFAAQQNLIHCSLFQQQTLNCFLIDILLCEICYFTEGIGSNKCTQNYGIAAAPGVP
jgi:hypothetical protein